MFYSAVEILPVYIGYTCLLLAKELGKRDAGFRICVPVQWLLQLLLYSLRSRRTGLIPVSPFIISRILHPNADDHNCGPEWRQFHEKALNFMAHQLY